MPPYAGGQRIAKLYRGSTPVARIYKGAQLISGSVEPLTGFSFVASGSGSGATIAIPGAAQAGDLCVIFNTTTGSTAEVIPSGFQSLISTSVGSSGRSVVSAKKLAGGESTVAGLSAGVPAWIVAVFRPNGSYSTIAANSVNQEGSTGNPAQQTIAAGGAPTLPVVLLGHMHSNGNDGTYRAIDPRTISPSMNEIASAGTGVSPAGQFAHYRIYNSSPANHTYDMDDEGQNILQSCYLTFG